MPAEKVDDPADKYFRLVLPHRTRRDFKTLGTMLQFEQISVPFDPIQFLVVDSGGVMKQLDYARLAEDCSKQADAMKPGPARDALIAKAKQYRSYAKMENWIGSQELQPPAN
jgi:hypothetical protein